MKKKKKKMNTKISINQLRKNKTIVKCKKNKKDAKRTQVLT